MCESVFACCGL